jgi:ElaB/YqjD/DUF883 family membrane-anchored ribosome-binding protein
MNTIEQTLEKSMNLSDEVIADFRDVVADAEALIKATAGHGGDKVAEIRARAEASLNAMKNRLAETQRAVLVKTREAAKATDVYVHENPWKAIGASAAVGMVIGLLIARR